MDLLTNYNYIDTLDYPEIIEKLRHGDSIILIENAPLSDKVLSQFISIVGDAIHENRNNNGQSIFDVKVTRQNTFFKSIANSNLSFPLHTDCSDFVSIPNCIGLLCVNPAPFNQGANTFAYIKDILKFFSKEEIEQLATKKWKHRKENRSILSYENKTVKICYDRITMESFSKISDSEQALLSKLDAIFKQALFKINLKKGDLILFRNDLFLHGRETFDLESDRLIKRIRFNVK